MGITNTIRQLLEAHIAGEDGEGEGDERRTDLYTALYERRPDPEDPDNEAAGSPPLFDHDHSLAFENVDFTPDANRSYLRSVLVMDSQRPVTRGPNPFIRHEGNFLVGIHIPKHKAAKDADDAADLIRDAFDVNTDLTKDGVLVRFRWAERGIATIVGDHYSTQVSIRFYTHNQR